MGGSLRPGGVHAADEAAILRIGTTEEFDSINPHLSFIGTSAEATLLGYDTLVGYGPDLGYAPTGFADAWVQDGTTWTFTIREGMRWSDGRPAGAADVAFTFGYLLASMDPAYVGPWAPAGNDLPRTGATRGDGAPDHPLSLYGDVLVDAAGLQSVELVDERTVTLTTVGPTSLVLGAAVPILPEHIWSTVTFARAATDFQAEPPVVGTGPFQIVEWQRARAARFVRNAFYRGPKPFLEEVRFQFHRDAAALADALRAGDIDYARSVLPEQVAALDADPGIVGLTGAGWGVTHLAFNAYRAEIDGGGASTPAVRDVRFRDALGFAVDHERLIDESVDGYGSAATTLIPPALVPFHREPARPRSFDPAEARLRLDQAGYRDADADGLREDLDGRPIDLRLFYPTTEPKFARAARAVADDWRRVGIEVTTEGLEADTLGERLYAPEAGGTADFDAVVWGWSTGPDPDFLLSLLTTAQIGGWSDSHYSNPAYDDLFERQRTASAEDRPAIVGRMLDLAYDEAPYLVLSYDDELHAHRTDRFEGWTVRPQGTGTSLFTSGVEGYLDLVPAGSTAPPSPSPAASALPSAPPSLAPGASAGPSLPFLPAGQTTTILIGLVVVVIALDLLLVVHRFARRPRR